MKSTGKKRARVKGRTFCISLNSIFIIGFIIQFRSRIQSKTSLNSITMTDCSNKRKAGCLIKDPITGDGVEALSFVKNLLKEHIQSSNERIGKLEQAVHELLRGKQDIQDVDEEISEDEESVTEKDDKWTLNFRSLRDYRITNGHCKVEKNENEKLFNWCRNQKLQYANTMARKKGATISEERIIKLESIEFNWGVKFPPPFCWDEMYEKLKEFKQRMGNCNVPFNENSPTALAKWLAFQRTEYRHFRFGRPCLMNLEQIGMLTELGVKWKGSKL